MCPDILPEDCDVWTQDCPEGYKCMPYANDGGSAWNGVKCFPVDPAPDPVGSPCTVVGNGVSGLDSCDEAAMCWGVDPETAEGTCYAFCTGSPENPMCSPGFACPIYADAILILCHPKCDPLAQDCADGDACLPYPRDVFICILDASGEMGAYGDPCDYSNACDPGLVCLNPEYVPGCQAGGCCTPFCDTSAPNTCPGDGQECIPWYEEGEAPEGYEHVGVCGVPQP